MRTSSLRLIYQKCTHTQTRCERRKCTKFPTQPKLLRHCTDPSFSLEYHELHFATNLCLQNVRMSEKKCWELERLYPALPKMYHSNFHSFKFSNSNIFKDGDRIYFPLIVWCNICWKMDWQGRFKFPGHLGEQSWHFLISSFGFL